MAQGAYAPAFFSKLKKRKHFEIIWNIYKFLTFVQDLEGNDTLCDIWKRQNLWAHHISATEEDIKNLGGENY